MKKITNLIHLLTILVCLFMVVCCTTNSTNEEYLKVFASHEKVPGWITDPPESNEKYIYFVGISKENVSSEKDAKRQAMADSRTVVIQYYGTQVKYDLTMLNNVIGRTSELIDPIVAIKEFENQFSQNVANFVHSKKVYTEKWKIGEKYGWKVYTLCTVPKKIAKNEIQSFLYKKYSKENIERIDNILKKYED